MRQRPEVLFATLEDDATLRLLLTVRAFGAHAAHIPRTCVILERLRHPRAAERSEDAKGTSPARWRHIYTARWYVSLSGTVQQVYNACYGND